MRGIKLNITKQDLERYIQEGKTKKEVSVIYRCHPDAIRPYLWSYGLHFKTGRRGGFKQTKEWEDKRKIWRAENPNPFQGKTHSDETKDLMSTNHADYTGEKNPFKISLKNPEKLKKFKDVCKKRWDGRSDAWKKDYAERLSKIMADHPYFKNNGAHKHHKSQHLETMKGGRIFCRSSWETLVANMLDECGNVLRFEKESFSVPYYDEVGTRRHTIIDFLIVMVNGREVVIEVKPNSLVGVGRNPYKIRGLKEYCGVNKIGFGVVTEEQVFNSNNFNNLLQSL